jgi:hypothetical protein
MQRHNASLSAGITRPSISLNSCFSSISFCLVVLGFAEAATTLSLAKIAHRHHFTN